MIKVLHFVFCFMVGVLLNLMGFDWLTWQFWAMLLLVMGIMVTVREISE